MKVWHDLILSGVVALCSACANTHQKSADNTVETPTPPAAEAATDEKLCQSPHVQCLDQAVPISLHLPNGTTFNETMQPPMLLIGFDTVYLFPGQTVYVEADVEGDKLVNLRAVPSIVHPEKTLTLKFEQLKLDTPVFPYVMQFSIQNPFDKILKYHAAAYYSPAAFNKGPEGLVNTDVCPILPKLQNFESWPNPIFQIAISDVRLVGADSPGAMVCE